MNTTRRSLLTTTAAAAGALAFPHVAGAAEPAKIRVGQIGTKHAHASGKLAAMRKLSDLYDVVGVVEPDAKRRQAIANTEAYRGIRFLTAEELLSDQGVAAVAVETSVDTLVPTAIQCLQAGKHIHLDKPAGSSMSACRAMHAEADRRGLTIQMGYMLRYNPAFEMLFQVVQDGWLGPITEISGMMGKMASDPLRKSLSAYPGGGMFELACHLIDAVVTVLGKPDRVTAHNRQTFPEKDSFVDNQLAVFDYPAAIATIRCNHLDPLGGPRRGFEVAGQQGAFQINPLEPPAVRLGLDRARGSFAKGFQNVKLERSSGRYDDEFRDLAKVIRGEKALRWDSSHDLAVHEAVLLASGLPLN
ncbi:Gfo/Idh/MocA family protein [Rosistilla oblonga]|uniref:Gfo/Idh/MocA family protein n=1 Tax=Rosistilla oblonga TaxID=2527990 RepID=UPI003A969069